MRVLLLLNGPRERYVGGADSARELKRRDYCLPVTQLEIGYLPSMGEAEAAPRCTHLERRRR
jgi:hypothetical protein